MLDFGTLIQCFELVFGLGQAATFVVFFTPKDVNKSP
jgi:hypothetical protein